MLLSYIARSRFRKPLLRLRELRKRIYSTTEMRIYCMNKGSEIKFHAPKDIVHKDLLSDLEVYDEKHGWGKPESFLSEAQSRLSRGEHVYTIIEKGKLIHFGWTMDPVEAPHIMEVGHTCPFPNKSIYLYDFFTHPDYRNRGLYQCCLAHILSEVLLHSELQNAFIGVVSKNLASRRAIEKVGFVYHASLFQKWRWNRVHRFSTETVSNKPPNKTCSSTTYSNTSRTEM